MLPSLRGSRADGPSVARRGAPGRVRLGLIVPRRLPWLLRGCLLPALALGGLAWWELRQPAVPVDSLQRAVEAGDLAAVRESLDSGADPDFSDYGVPPPLVAAVAAGRVEIARLLLERGAAPDRPGALEGDLSPLATALANGDVAMQQLLLDAGADPAGPGTGGAPLLFDAVRLGDAAAVRRLVAAGADVDVRDADGAAWDGAVGAALRSARELAAKMDTQPPRTADPEALTGITPLMLAARRDEPAVLEALLGSGADPDARDGAGATPLSHAARSPWCGPEGIRMLLAAGANPRARDASGRSPIDYARGPELPRPALAEMLERRTP